MVSSDGRPSHMPKLAYRRPAPVDMPPIQSRLSTSTSATDSTANTTTTQSTHVTPATSIDESWPPTPGQSTEPHPSMSTKLPSRQTRSPVKSASRKKKTSFLDALLVKEPTSVALEQFAQQMVAQHGELSPRAIPHVSSNKMPEKVPKVNSKWDGVPQAVKHRQRARQASKQETDPARLSSSSGRSRSIGLTNRDGTSRDPKALERLTWKSTINSFTSGTSSTRQYQAKHGTMSSSRTGDSFMSSSSIDLATTEDKSRSSVRPHGISSPSAGNVPEVTAIFSEEIPETPPLPAQYLNESRTNFSASKMVTLLDPVLPPAQPLPLVRAPDLEYVPDHTSSPWATPPEASPLTPLSDAKSHHRGSHGASVLSTRLGNVHLLSSGTDVPGSPATAKRTSKLPGQAFLTGEARPFEFSQEQKPGSTAVDLGARRKSGRDSSSPTPLPLQRSTRAEQGVEKRLDSSRGRLDFSASMKKGEAASWELEKAMPLPTSPKGITPEGFGLFRKEKA